MFKRSSELKEAQALSFKVSFGISLLCLILLYFGGKFSLSDFEVYYRAADRLLSGEGLYRIREDGHFVFKYSPFFAALFIPFTFFGLSFSKIIFFFIVSLSVFFVLDTLVLAGSEGENSKKDYYIIYFVTFLMASDLWTRDLKLGQINLIMLALLILVSRLLSSGEKGKASFLWALCLFIKPYSALLFPLIFLKRDFKTLGYTFLFCVLFFFFPIVFTVSFEKTLILNKDWISELGVELSSKVDFFRTYNFTLGAAFAQFFPSRIWSSGAVFLKIYQFAFALALGVFFLSFTKEIFKKNHYHSKEILILISFIPFLSATDRNSYLYMLPVVIFCLWEWRKGRVSGYWILLASLLFGGNIYDLLGRDLHLYLLDKKVVTFGAFLFLILYRRSFSRLKQTNGNS